MKIPEGYGAWVVAVRYEDNDDLFFHKDNDYDAGDFGYIVSLTLAGSAVFNLKVNKESKEVTCSLCDERAYAFDQTVVHGVSKTKGRRLNLTIRWAPKGNKILFKPTPWFKPPRK